MDFLNISLLFVILLGLFNGAISEVKPWDLPALPQNYPKLLGNISTDQLIQRHLWIAVRESNTTLNAQLPSLFERNPNWEVHIVSNDMKDEFMNTVFTNTSLLWAYNMIHPIAGAAKADLWRYAVLWAYGGAYVDDDSDIRRPFDKFILPDDELIISYEKNGLNANKCYVSNYHLSDYHTLKAYPDAHTIFKGRIILNWALFAAPHHPILSYAIEMAVEIIKYEYLRESVMRSMYTLFGWESIMCSTGPSLLTTSARELLLRNGTNIKYRLAGMDFRECGGVFKAIYVPVRNDPNHYMKIMNKNRDLLKEYMPELPFDENRLKSLQGKPIQGQNGREIFVIDDMKRRSIPNYDTFVNLNFSMSDVYVISNVRLSAIPLGDTMPNLST